MVENRTLDSSYWGPGNPAGRPSNGGEVRPVGGRGADPAGNRIADGRTVVQVPDGRVGVGISPGDTGTQRDR
jgi:hypothetical protein